MMGPSHDFDPCLQCNAAPVKNKNHNFHWWLSINRPPLWGFRRTPLPGGTAEAFGAGRNMDRGGLIRDF